MAPNAMTIADQFWVYNPGANEWTDLKTTIATSDGMRERYGFGMTHDGDEILVFGGACSSVDPNINKGKVQIIITF